MALEVRSQNKIERLLGRIHSDVAEIKSDLKDVKGKLIDKKTVVKNSQSKGVLLLRVRSAKVKEIFGNQLKLTTGQYIYYIHGGLDSRWSEYTEDKKNYDIVRSFKNISDHDKFLREVKEELRLVDSTVKPKRNYLILTNPLLDQVIGCYSQRDTKCAIEA